MNCRLCRNDRKLCDSHIIPEFFYRPMYDEKHRIIRMSTVPEEKTTYAQQGIYEKMLCTDCEQHINDFEKHARRLFFERMDHIETGNSNEIKVINLVV